MFEPRVTYALGWLLAVALLVRVRARFRFRVRVRAGRKPNCFPPVIGMTRLWRATLFFCLCFQRAAAQTSSSTPPACIR